MFSKALILFMTLACASPSWSFNCYFTLAKDSCWTDFNVSVDVVVSTTSTKLLTIEVPAGKSWGREIFSCTPAQGLIYTARFSPVFWKEDEGKVFKALRSWSLPGEINPGELAWTIPVCFPGDFSQVPFPPKAKGNCKCDFSSIPEPKPTQ